MPNRILRDWTDSFTVNLLDVSEERFFVRLIMKADDFGRFHADTRLLKASLFPLLPDTRESDISRWLAACEKAGLLRVYVDGKSRNYLEIANFKQRSRQSESKFPPPASDLSAPEGQQIAASQATDRQLTVSRPSADRQLRTYSKTETKTIFGDATRAGEAEPLCEVLAEIFPGIASDRRAMDGLTVLALQFQATSGQIRGFPSWLERNHPKKALNHFAFRDHFHQSLKGDLKTTGNGRAPESPSDRQRKIQEGLAHLAKQEARRATK